MYVGGDGDMMINFGGSVSVQQTREIYDYYVVFDPSGDDEAIGVLARADFNNRVELTGYDDEVKLRVFNRWGSETKYPCKGITKAEYETYIEFGIPDISTETSWKKWLKTQPMKWLKKKK